MEGWDYILFTDQLSEGRHGCWEIRAPRVTFECPVRTARYHKINPHELFPDQAYSLAASETDFARAVGERNSQKY
jgi:hypothetical protein